MAALLRHPFDFCGVCRVCGKHCEQRYDFEDVVPSEDDTQLGTARQYTCTSCNGSYHRDFEPRSGYTDDDLGTIVDHRSLERIRKTLLGIPAPAPVSAPGPATRGVLSEEGRRYSFVREGA